VAFEHVPLQTGCGSNVRQISQALLLYADINESRLGGGIERRETWLEATEVPNVGDIGKCPAFSLDNQGRPGPSPNLQGYALNACLGRNLAVSEPSKIVLVTEVTSFSSGNNYLDVTKLSGPDVFEFAKGVPAIHGGISWDHQSPFGALRHRGGCLYSFVDGHVKWLRPDQLRLPAPGYTCPEMFPNADPWRGPQGGPRFSTIYDP
jgi:prepilin-type processing-associated H-X9-DG protein